jgi:hypothetical protein
MAIVSRQKKRKENNIVNNTSESLGKETVKRRTTTSELEKQIEELKKQIEDSKLNESKSKIVEDVAPNERIKVMSLVNNPLTLSTMKSGGGKRFEFDRFGETRNILYSDLLDVNNNHKNFLEAGYYYILDDRVVALEGLEDIYEHILTKDKIEKVLSNEKDAIALFQKANPKQQDVVIRLIKSKLINNEPIDFNLVNELTRVSGREIQKEVNNTLEAKAAILEK